MRRCMTIPVLLAAPLVLLARGAAGQPCAPFLTDDFRDGPRGVTNDMAVFDDGSGHGPRLYMAGAYAATGNPYKRVVTWDGRTWEALPAAPGVAGLLDAACVHDNGRGPTLFIGGDIESADPGAPRNVARWDGGAWAAVGDGPGGPVSALRSLNGQLVAGGSFTGGDGAMSGVAAWDGNAWMLLGTLGGDATELAAFNGAIYAATAEPINGNVLWRWDGIEWSTVGTAFEATVNALVAWDDGSGPALFVGGAITQIGAVTVSNIARWDGTEWTSPGTGVSEPVVGMALWDGTGETALWVAGESIVSPLARWDGKTWKLTANELLRATRLLCVFDDGHGPELITAGSFRDGRVLRGDEPVWLAFTNNIDGNCPSGGYGPTMNALVRGGNSRLYAGGGIEQIGRAVGGVFQWEGGEWTSLGPDGFEGCEVTALLEHDVGATRELYAGGVWDSTRLIRYDGTSWDAVAEGDGEPAVLTFFDDGLGGGPALYVGGRAMTSFGGAVIANLARWDGSTWSSPGAITGNNALVYAMVVFDDGSGPALYIGGRFTAVNGVPAGHVARWDGSTWSTLAGGVNGVNPGVFWMRVFDDGRGPALFISGPFSGAGGVPVSGIARWNGTGWESVGDDPSYGGPMEVFDAGDGERLYVANAEGIRRWDGRWWTWWDYDGAAPEGNIGHLVAVEGPDAPSLFATTQYQGLQRIRACALTDVGDINNDGAIDMLDIDELFAAWGPCSPPCPADIWADGVVDALDLLTLLRHWTR